MMLVQLTVSDGVAEFSDAADISIIPQPWRPADNTIYVFEGEKTIYELYCDSREAYLQTSKAVSLAIIIHNRDYDTTWNAVYGVCTW